MAGDTYTTRTPAEVSRQARMAAHVLHSRHDSRELTANAREAFLARFEREVDPEGVLAPDERERRIQHARRAHFTRLAHASAAARRTRRRAA